MQISCLPSNETKNVFGFITIEPRNLTSILRSHPVPMCKNAIFLYPYNAEYTKYSNTCSSHIIT